jgi:hypothetical protein
MEDSMAIKFRCTNSRPTEWHFEDRCPEWPHSDYAETREVPPTPQLCSKCVDLKARELLTHLISGKDALSVVQ